MFCFFLDFLEGLKYLEHLALLDNLVFLDTLDNKKSPGPNPGDYYREGIVNYLTITFLPSMM